jgi:N utilization substance protein B
MGGGRRSARREAVFILYQADLLGLPPAKAMMRATGGLAGDETDPYSRHLVDGVAERQEEIDEVIARYLTGWSLERLAPLERNVLRVATFELAYADDVPAAVAIGEAVELAKRYCSDEAASLVNGVLAAVQRERERAPDRGSSGEYTESS